MTSTDSEAKGSVRDTSHPQCPCISVLGCRVARSEYLSWRVDGGAVEAQSRSQEIMTNKTAAKGFSPCGLRGWGHICHVQQCSKAEPRLVLLVSSHLSICLPQLGSFMSCGPGLSSQDADSRAHGEAGAGGRLSVEERRQTLGCAASPQLFPSALSTLGQAEGYRAFSLRAHMPSTVAVLVSCGCGEASLGRALQAGD